MLSSPFIYPENKPLLTALSRYNGRRHDDDGQKDVGAIEEDQEQTTRATSSGRDDGSSRISAIAMRLVAVGGVADAYSSGNSANTFILAEKKKMG